MKSSKSIGCTFTEQNILPIAPNYFIQSNRPVPTFSLSFRQGFGVSLHAERFSIQAPQAGVSLVPLSASTDVCQRQDGARKDACEVLAAVDGGCCFEVTIHSFVLWVWFTALFGFLRVIRKVWRTARVTRRRRF